MTLPEIAPDALPEGAYLLDVREDEEWRAGHAPEAVHIPLGELQARVDEVPPDRPVYVVCRVGGRSAHAAMWLNHIGREAVNVDGGMMSWAAAGRPMVSETGGNPYVA
ncbi:MULTISPECIES: rhodanese-like domain-containing protein [Microbispora]|uniref:Rhodanese-like domain-containing protein n=3 Tax=Microbispora TaxID=2005 RepID=A0ABY3M6D1_9ACTN|nr:MULTISPECIES: rhodanese-like domain-containing protein [Microbispora]RGA01043.1 rhodanese-like domain-containing protein [Microbispora triticiradicis]TLP66467.1 rhodanese-like domain-containing protein [Microbispora fusca]TYB68251.1 rhodanese-like domain-containing protein [Microbispora tritici]GLW23968.1 sulfurtransferase [Microbispora amethystogenes]